LDSDSLTTMIEVITSALKEMEVGEQSGIGRH
jgi:hypothetical protein